MKLIELPNIGKTLEKELNNVGIKSVEELRKIGSVEATVRLNNYEKSCYNKLYALEGAIQNVRWHQLSKDHRTKLKIKYDQMTS